MTVVAERHTVGLEQLAPRLEEQARRLEAQRDSRCVFTCAYALMTRRIAAELPKSDIRDPDWIIALAQDFAGRYEAALAAWDDKTTLPPGWQVVFSTICARRTSVIEDLIFAMASHIMRDLPHALLATGLTGPDGSSRIADYHTVNRILGDSIDDVQLIVSKRYGHYVRWLDQVGGGYDEILTNYGVRLSRGMAWYNALRLADPASARAAAEPIERSPGVFVHEVMNPPLASVRLALRAGRFIVALLRRWPASAAEHGPRSGEG
jgi:Family of unknown function (DUF5995)